MSDHHRVLCLARVSLDPAEPIVMCGAEGDHVATGATDEMCRHQDHEVIFTDGYIALSLYECLYAVTGLRTGDVRGSLWDYKTGPWKPSLWKMSPESIARVMAIHAAGAEDEPEETDAEVLARLLDGAVERDGWLHLRSKCSTPREIALLEEYLSPTSKGARQVWFQP